MAAGPPPPEAYRIDELARLGGTTVRNVRAYQDRGLVAPPARVGRAGWYSEAHLARLRLIGEMLGRGYSLANIAELLEGWRQGHDLGGLLGLDQAGSAAAELVEAGVPPETLGALGAEIAAVADRLARRSLEMATAGSPTPDQERRRAEVVSRLRPWARAALDAGLAAAFARLAGGAGEPAPP